MKVPNSLVSSSSSPPPQPGAAQQNASAKPPRIFVFMLASSGSPFPPAAVPGRASTDALRRASEETVTRRAGHGRREVEASTLADPLRQISHGGVSHGGGAVRAREARRPACVPLTDAEVLLSSTGATGPRPAQVVERAARAAQAGRPTEPAPRRANRPGTGPAWFPRRTARDGRGDPCRRRSEERRVGKECR